MTDEQRLSRYTVVGECWEWSGWRLPSGYGTLRLRNRGPRGRTVMAHRLAYETWVGPIPQGQQVCHRCDNPPCIRPDHLWLGTQHDNLMDMVAKGRDAKVKPRRRFHGIKITEEQAREAIDRYQAGERATEIAAALGVTAGYIRMLSGSRPSPHVTHGSGYTRRYNS